MNDRVYILRQSVGTLTNLLTGRGIQVTQQGLTAFVAADETGRPVRVNLPYVPDNASDDLINAIHGFLDHEIGHVLDTDFKAVIKAGGRGTRLGSMLNIVEDTRIERRMEVRFRGSRYNLENTRAFFLKKYSIPKIEEAQAIGDHARVIAVLMVPLVRALAGQQCMEDFIQPYLAADPTLQKIHARLIPFTAELRALKTTWDALELAAKFLAAIHEPPKEAPPPRPPPPEKEEGEGENQSQSQEEDTGDEDATPEQSDPTEEQPEEQGEEVASGGDGGEDPAEEEPGEPAEEEAEAEAEEEDHSAGGDLADRVPQDVLDAIDDETQNDFDDVLSEALTDSTAMEARGANYLPYTCDNDRIEPLHVGKKYDPSMLKQIQDDVDHMVGPMQKDLERAIAARSMVLRSFGHRSGKLHAGSLARLSIKTSAGFDDRVFYRKQEQPSKDIAVELVMDISGSMNGSKMRTAARACYALASTLDRIKIPFEVIAFTTGDDENLDMDKVAADEARMGHRFARYEPIVMPIIKGWDERMGTDVKQRFGFLPHSQIPNCNIDGESILIAGQRLLAQRQQGKTMFVFSDGLPAGGSGGTGLLQRHLKDAVQSLVRRGVRVVGLGIESNAVEKFYPNHVVMRDVNELPMIVMKQLRALIMNQ